MKRLERICRSKIPDTQRRTGGKKKAKSCIISTIIRNSVGKIMVNSSCKWEKDERRKK